MVIERAGGCRMKAPEYFSTKVALFLLELSQFTGKQYGHHGIIKHNGLIDPFPKGYKHILSFRANPFRKRFEEWIGFVLESEDSIIVAFRSPKYKLQQYSDTSSFQSLFTRVEENAKIHNGILSTYESCRDELFDLYQRLPKHKTLFITGYRYGGALATIHAVDVSVNLPFEKVVMYNFACPRVGDESFAKIYNLHVPLSFRILYGKDPYPHAPLPLSTEDENTEELYTHIDYPILLPKLNSQEKNLYSFQNYRQGIERLKRI